MCNLVSSCVSDRPQQKKIVVEEGCFTSLNPKVVGDIIVEKTFSNKKEKKSKID
jgi:hypothetical protein